jgi:hypothetical protein
LVQIYNNRPKSSVLKQLSNFEYSSVIEKSEKYKYKGITYNLEVEDDNSYIANGIVVHNCVMTIVNTTSIFPKNEFKEMVEDWSNIGSDKEFMNYVNQCLKNLDYVQAVDYGQVLRIKNQNKNKYKNNESGINWFGVNKNN